MAAHKLQLTLVVDDADPAAATLAVVHRVTVPLAGQRVSHAEEVRLDNEPAVKAALMRLLDANKDAVTAAAMPLALNHVAATTNQNQKNTKRVGLGGKLGAIGDAKGGS